MYCVQPVFANNFGGNAYYFNTMEQAHDCAMTLFEEEENVTYVDVSSSTSGDYIRMYRKKGGDVGLKAPWELPEDEV